MKKSLRPAARTVLLGTILLAVGLIAPVGCDAEVLFPVLPAILNVFPTFGLGSFVQGDLRGGAFQLVCEVVVATPAILGVFCGIGWWLSGFDAPGLEAAANTLFAIGEYAAYLMIPVLLYGVVRPFWFWAKDRNSVRVAVSFIPQATMENGRLAFGAAVVFKP
jgi:hypothetical protein